MQQQQIIHVNDEIVINQFLQMLKNIFTNISIFILCIFLFMNPILLVNALLFISIFLFVKACFSYFTEEKIVPSLPQSVETEIKIFDDSDLLRDRIRKLKRENTVLRDKLDRTDRKHKKRQNIITPTQKPFTFEPFKINVDFLDIENDTEIKVKNEEIKNEEIKNENQENEVNEEIKNENEKNEEIKNENQENEVNDKKEEMKLSLDLEKIITDAINDMISSSEMFKERDGFAILSPIPSTPVETDEDDE